MGLFSSPHRKNIAVIDIASGSVAGAILALPTSGTPVLLGSVRVAIRSQDEKGIGLVRALDELAHTLLEHAPKLRTLTGTGSIEETYVSIGAPWQEMRTSTKVLEDKKSFFVTDALLKKIRDEGETSEDVVSNTTIQSALLNGYSVREPKGKLVSRAEFHLLSASIPKELHAKIVSGVRKIAPHRVWVNRTDLMERVIRTICPRESEFIATIVTEEETTLMRAHAHTVQEICSMPLGTASFTRTGKQSGVALLQSENMIDMERNTKLAEALQKVEQTWLATFSRKMLELAKSDALPTTVFLFSEHSARDYLKRLLEKPALASLWLSGNTPTIIPILPANFAKRLSFEQSPELDSTLLALALYAWGILGK